MYRIDANAEKLIELALFTRGDDEFKRYRLNTQPQAAACPRQNVKIVSRY